MRIIRAAAELDIESVAVHSEDDVSSLHNYLADHTIPLKGSGPPAYLDIDHIISVARENSCNAIHPGYGFLSENAAFARRCDEEDIIFVGPKAATLEILGDKAQARTLAKRCGVPLLCGSSTAISLHQAETFFSTLGGTSSMIIKAISGGGGRGMRVVNQIEELEEAFNRCQSEARQAFGNDAVYVEQLMSPARHIEVQIAGDGSGAVTHFYERECSIQRRFQKLMEVAPSPGLPPTLRDQLIGDAVRMAQEVRYSGLGTFEFVVQADPNKDRSAAEYAFIEANPRLQVEHTVTEQISGVDLVQLQLQLASGKSLAELGLSVTDTPKPNGFALQVRINMETMNVDGTVTPSGGTITTFDPPSGMGVRNETFGYADYKTNPNFDSLLAKLIGHSNSSDFKHVIKKTARALDEYRIEGVSTNIPLLQNILQHPDFQNGNIYTEFVQDHAEELTICNAAKHRPPTTNKLPARHHPGAKVDSGDPLAVLSYGKSDSHQPVDPNRDRGSTLHQIENDQELDGRTIIQSHLQGTVVIVDAQEGDQVEKGQQVLVMNAMKMEHVVKAPVSGWIVKMLVTEGDAVCEMQPLFVIDAVEIESENTKFESKIDLDLIRPDLEAVLHRLDILEDSHRPESVNKRHKKGQRTARENIADLCDDGSFEEYGGLLIAAQRRRRPEQELIEKTPADGLVAGIGHVNGHLFNDDKSRCIVMSYDYMVLAGTQGHMNHTKKDRMFELAERWQLPVVFFTEGGGGRPGDTDLVAVSGLNVQAFYLYARLSGRVPLIGITTGRCFAGNAAILGCCDVVIATRNANIGMGGPAMVEGGGLGIFQPEEIGPMEVQVPNGVVDVEVEDEAEAVRVAKNYLSYFQGPVKKWECADQRALRAIVPENRLRVYDIRKAIKILADTGSVLELRPKFGHGMITAFIRIEGRPMGVIANNPGHLSGAIDSAAADKGSRFIQLCDNFDIPILSLCDTPGIMVGPEVEKTALVRHCCRMFLAGANVTVPFFTIILRKCYGLGAIAMVGGSSRAPLFVVAWPSGEFGGMGLEGAVKLAFRDELSAIEDPKERRLLFDQMVAMGYDSSKALNAASCYEIDDVIDPTESRRVITRALRSVPQPDTGSGKKHRFINSW